MTNEDLIKKAASVINPKQLKDGLIGDVGCALISETGKVLTATCVGTNSNVICAERAAVGKLISDAGELVVSKIVATWKDEAGALYVIPPCGNCRQFLRDTDLKNLETEVVLDNDKAVPLKELLPYHDWWQKVK